MLGTGSLLSGWVHSQRFKLSSVTLRFTAFLSLNFRSKAKETGPFCRVRSVQRWHEHWRRRFCWKNVPKLSPSHAPSFLHATEVRGSILRWRRIVTHVGWWWSPPPSPSPIVAKEQQQLAAWGLKSKPNSPKFMAVLAARQRCSTCAFDASPNASKVRKWALLLLHVRPERPKIVHGP